jgi:Transcription factor WhiB
MVMSRSTLSVVTRHKPNLMTSQWVQPLDESMLGASCLDHQSLPWTADIEPSALSMHQMRDICRQCPVIVKCAQRALHGNSGRGAEGGMYAGVWLSWVTRSDNATKRIERRRAQEALQRLIR